MIKIFLRYPKTVTILELPKVWPSQNSQNLDMYPQRRTEKFVFSFYNF